MKNDFPAKKNWFDAGGSRYAQFRPEYPTSLALSLAELTTKRSLAVDVGCGNGQLTAQLAPHFAGVVGVDPSADQIAHAKPADGVKYKCAPAEKLPLSDGVANLITAAQAAHWFDLPVFFAEVRRVAADEAVLALISYGVLELESPLDERFNKFYTEEVGAYWPAERKLVDTGYAQISFPFEELRAPVVSMQKQWDLESLMGYISTWSAVQRAREAGKEEMLTAFAADMAALWGEPSSKRQVAWPINMRVGRI